MDVQKKINLNISTRFFFSSKNTKYYLVSADVRIGCSLFKTISKYFHCRVTKKEENTLSTIIDRVSHQYLIQFFILTLSSQIPPDLCTVHLYSVAAPDLKGFSSTSSALSAFQIPALSGSYMQDFYFQTDASLHRANQVEQERVLK